MNAAREKPIPLYNGHSKTPSPSASRRRPILRISRRFRLVALVVLTPLLAFVTIAYPSFIVPDNYRVLLTANTADQESDGYQFEQSIAQFHNDVQAGGDWELRVEAKQLNGWLATHLNRKFPTALPDLVEDPRIVIEEEKATLFVKVRRGGMKVVVQGSVEFFLTEEPNTIGVRIQNARCGWLPVPITQWIESVTNSLSKGGIRVKWAQGGGEPIALLQIPERIEEFRDYRFIVRSVRQVDSVLVFAGSMEYSPLTD